MAREYPRFLYSNPQNSKSKGPFIIHTLTPRMICRVNIDTLASVPFSVIELWDDYNQPLQPVLNDMFKWFLSQIKQGDLLFD
jgi:hypothetical protein